MLIRFDDIIRNVTFLTVSNVLSIFAQGNVLRYLFRKMCQERYDLLLFVLQVEKSIRSLIIRDTLLYALNIPECSLFSW